MYDHTRIASYQHWCVGNIGRPVRLLALDGRNAELAGGFPGFPGAVNSAIEGLCWYSFDTFSDHDIFLQHSLGLKRLTDF